MIDLLVPFVVIGLLGTFALVFAATRFPSDEARWLVRLLLLAFAVRIAVASMFGLVPSTRLFHEDAYGYEFWGEVMAAGWHGHGPPLDMSERNQNYGYYYVTAALYYVLGRWRVAPSYFNALLGALNVYMVYRLARQFFHVVVARRAALLCAFIPSMILWNAIAIKDTLMATLLLVTLSACVALKRRFSVLAVLGTVLPILGMQPIRFYMVYILAAAVVLSLFFERGMNAVTGVWKQIAFALIAVALVLAVGASGRLQEGAEVLDLQRVSAFRQGMAQTAQSGLGEVDVSTPGRAIAFLPLGVAYLLFSPFPWQMTSLRAGLAGPEMVVWWLFIPSLIRGIVFTVRRRFADCSPLLLFSAILTLAYSLVHGNVGSGFRQRSQIFIFLFIFASLGSYLARCRRRGIDEGLLLTDITTARPAAPPQQADPGAQEAA